MYQDDQGLRNRMLQVFSDGITYIEDSLESAGVYPFGSRASREAVLIGEMALRLARLAQTPNAVRILETLGFGRVVQIFIRCCAEIMSTPLARMPITMAVDARQMSLPFDESGSSSVSPYLTAA